MSRETAFQKIKNHRAQQFGLPMTADWTAIETIDMHTAGEPLRVILAGFPELPGNDVLSRRRSAREQYDDLRKALMWEPRGHRDMYGVILVPPNDDGADFGAIFLHNEGYSTMCGHAVIALAKLAVEMGWVEPCPDDETSVVIDAPCGRIRAFARTDSRGRVFSTRFLCVPSFVLARDQTIALPGLGTIRYDIAYGGAFYAYVDARQLPFSLAPENSEEIIRAGRAIKAAVIERGPPIEHPAEPDLSFLYGTIFMDMSQFPESTTEPASDSRIHSGNVCVFANGELDRSPTGSGVSGRLALHHAQGRLTENQTLHVKSITGGVFTGKISGVLDYCGHAAVIPEISGTAHITGQHRFYIDPADPLKNGFLLG
ncbi:proline racemase family protein [Microbulbifer aggregans]|uniref:proline racemase family protein n=1 Tax=Microbulbifer aggregans TaxID=1769779 RepID=UPI001CFC6D23|nr:proline racemase family protein [Microbulbifer aggregans]